MVTICGRKFANTREKLLLGGLRKKQQDQQVEQFFSKLKEQREQVRVLSGTSIPNSTFKSIHSAGANEQRSPSENGSVDALSSPNPIRLASTLSGTETLEELKQMRDLLHKSSYVPKKTPTRRPTIEKIKSAIEREKRWLDEQDALSVVKEESVQLTDASTSTAVFKAKKKRKKKKPKSDGSDFNEKKVKKCGKIKIKMSSKVDVEIQCSIYKAPVGKL